MSPEETAETCPGCSRDMWTAVPPASAAEAKETTFCPHCQRANMAAQGRADSQTHELADALLKRGDHGVALIWQEHAVPVPGEAVRHHGFFRFIKGDSFHVLGLLADASAFFAAAARDRERQTPGLPASEDQDD